MGTSGDRIGRELGRLPRRAYAMAGMTLLIGCASTPAAKPSPLPAPPGEGRPEARRPPAEGRLELTISPPDAQVFVDGERVAEEERSVIVRKAGTHVLSVTRPGYARSDHDVVLSPERTLRMDVRLEPSFDTGFELTTDPSGLLVWLDGEPVKGQDGEPVRTNFRASRIPPGRHVLELRGDDARFQPWREEVEIEPGAIKKVHAVMRRSAEP